MRNRSLFSLVGILLLLATPAQGQSPEKASQENREKAAALFQKAEAFYIVQEYEKALELYKEAYLLSLQPELIFNMAQCYRQLGRHEEALKSYRSFLRQLPDTPLQASVEKLIADTEALLAKASESPTDPVPAGGTPTEPVVKNPEPGGVTPGPVDPVTPVEPAVPASDAGLPGSSKILFGVAAGSGALGLIVGTLALSSANLTLDFEETLEMDQVVFKRSRAVAQAALSDVLLVGALVSGGVGILMARKAKKANTEARVSLSPRGASLSLRF